MVWTNDLTSSSGAKKNIYIYIYQGEVKLNISK